MKNKLLSLFCVIAMLFSLLPLTALADGENAIYPVDGTNSGREANNLIIYNKGVVTKTNEWGYEVCVDSSNRVTSVGGNNSIIPKGGFVASGHGPAAEFLKANVKVGDKVVFMPEQMIISVGENEPSPFYSFTLDIAGVNIYRSADTTVIYTPSIGPTTGSNDYGFEVTVADGLITSCGGNNSKIPSGGFVISAHGEGATRLRAVAKVGMEASYDSVRKTVTLTFGEKTIVNADGARLADAEGWVKTALDDCYVIDVAQVKQTADEARKLYDSLTQSYNESGDISPYLDSRDRLHELINKLNNITSESRPVEYRAVWIEPTDRNADDVKKTVQAAYDAGLNTICLEVLFDSTMIYPTPEGSLFEHNPVLRGFDMLQAYIDECHARGMELHAWMPVFMVGAEGGRNSNRSLFTKKPEWRIVSNSGSNYDDSSTAQTLNPANPELCDFLLETYRYILENYDIDGFQLDYIRYPHNGDSDFGYDAATVAAFKEKYGVVPEYKPSEDYWADWCQFRCDIVTSFVRRVRELIDEVAPNVLLSADLYGNMTLAPRAVYQDGERWIKEGLLDIVFPMTYDTSELLYDKAQKYINAGSGTDTVFSCGIGAYIGAVDEYSMREQVKLLRKLGGDGCTFFELSSFITKDAASLLSQSVFSQPAIAPFRDIYRSVTEYCKFISLRAAEIMLPAGLITQDEADAAAAVLNAIIGGDLTESSVAALDELISSITNKDAVRILSSDMAFIERLVAHYDWSGPKPLPSESSEVIEETSDSTESTNSSDTEASTNSSPYASDPSSTGEVQGSGIPAAAIIGAAACALCAAAVVIILILRKKKK